jgi:hypothetical protein
MIGMLGLYRLFRPGFCTNPRELEMKALFTITAVFEGITGIGLALVPSRLVVGLLGSPSDSPEAVIIARVLAAALVSLAVACWFAREDARSRAATGLAAAMLLYNIAVVGLLAYARVALGISGVGLLPAAITHSALAVWCVARLVTQAPGKKTWTMD